LGRTAHPRLSLGSAIKNALLPQRSSNGDRTKVIKTLINSSDIRAKARGDVGSVRGKSEGDGWQNRNGRESERLRL